MYPLTGASFKTCLAYLHLVQLYICIFLPFSTIYVGLANLQILQRHYVAKFCFPRGGRPPKTFLPGLITVTLAPELRLPKTLPTPGMTTSFFAKGFKITFLSTTELLMIFLVI